MTDQNNNSLARELRGAESLEAALTRMFAAMQLPHGAAQRLLAKLEGTFHESQLTLDDAGPYSFEMAAAQARFDANMPDLLAAGLEEDQIDESEFDSEEE